MKLGDLASIATIVEAVFVVISVLFIWYELRKNNRLTKAANVQSLVELSSPLNLQLIQDRQVADLWVRGAQKFNDMDEVDRYRYQSLLVWWLILHEHIYYQWRNGLLDTGIYMSWASDLEEFVRRQALEVYWDKLKDNYQSEFATHVGQLIETHKGKINSGDVGAVN